MVGPDKIMTGNLLFAACCLFYLVWWAVAFRPGFTAPMAVKSILLLITAGFGIAGLILIVNGCNIISMTHDGLFRSCITVIASGAALYALLLFVTWHFMHRQVTTELMLIVFWVCMEVCVILSLHEADVFAKAAAIVIAAVVIIAAAIGMISYLAYYGMEPMKAYYDGMVPLVLFGIVMAGMSVYQMKGC